MKTLKILLKELNKPFGITVFTIIIGNLCIVQPFQRNQWKEQHKLERENEKQKEAIKYFESLSDLMDKRLFLTRQFMWSIKSDQKEKALQEIIDEWNKQLNKNIVKISMYFNSKDQYKFNANKCEKDCSQSNKELCECNDKQRRACREDNKDNRTIENEWECEIHLNFRCVYDNTLKEYKKNSSNKNLRSLAEDQLDCLNQRIYQFDRHILNTIIGKNTDSPQNGN